MKENAEIHSDYYLGVFFARWLAYVSLQCADDYIDPTLNAIKKL